MTVETGDPAAPPQSSDTYAKTLALLRRLLVGNGYLLEDIKLETVETTDLHLPGRVALELQVIPVETRTPGHAKGNEAAVFKTRPEAVGYIQNFHNELGSDQSWVEEVRALLAKSSGQGWGMAQGDWQLPKLSKRIAVILPCDICRGQKMETCKLCFGQREEVCKQCNGAREAWCPTCHGSGTNPADRNSICLQCRGKMKLPCVPCMGKGRIQCHQCRGVGLTQCTNCNGLGFFNEETFLKVAAQGRFELGSLAATPKGVTQVLDALGETGVAKGHAVITPVPPRGDGATAIEFDAILPYGRFNLKMKNDVHEVIAVGMKPVLYDFPPLLDDALSHIPEQLNAGSLTAMARKYRLVRELAEALGKGEKPARFFSQRYPFGLTAPLAFAISGKLKQVFASASRTPRAIVGAVAVPLALGAYYGWLTQPHPALPVQPMVLDGAGAVLLAIVAWLATAIAGQQALKRIMPTPAGLLAAGGTLALLAALTVLAGCAGLLYTLQPEWVGALLK